MGLPWPGISSNGGDLAGEAQQQIQALLNAFGDRLVGALSAQGLPPHTSPLFRPWNLLAGLDDEKVIAIFSPLVGGTADLRWFDWTGQRLPVSGVAAQVQAELGWNPVTPVSFAREALDDHVRQPIIDSVVQQHMGQIEHALRLGRLGDLSGLEHLEPFLRVFLDDHPDPERNVLVMMRFKESERYAEIMDAIRDTLSVRGFHAMRADDRLYSDELWTNVETYLVGCKLGIAVFEDIELRDFNPNVSLELGYMLAKRRRCLILKEQRLPSLPTDVIGRLYRPFDSYGIAKSVTEQVVRWVDTDLRLS